ncbi:hypothetical protein [Bosea sp. (in: a-proteobacteria)]|uniref:hypothetical protein n=1 Tax=Bosea sp. (in: a-proteobacteria) TaxID=1871050 RepID=UPI00262AC5EF|nr:hypothetical protein [Bosea sp. (in: a-proteobacteria)]MCO5091986.1 hypothetical protein [Bosea sp. (in: a-proteobacteria)]
MSKSLTRSQIADLCGCKEGDIPATPLFSLTDYTPSGPVCAAYIRSLGPIDAITGPAGSGKTVGSIFKVIRFAVGAMPVCTDGVVRVRGAVLRDNFRALYRTTLRSWFEFFPPDYGGAHFTGGQDRPAQHILKLSTVRMVDGALREVPVELTVDFFAVGDIAIEELLKGYECSFFWVNEGDLLHERVIPFAYSRTGRYPPRARLSEGVKLPRVVAVDFNPPAPKHPLWLACQRRSFNAGEEEAGMGHNGGPALDPLPAEGAAATLNFFHQPSGLSPDAENRAGKTYAQYEEEGRTLPEEDVRRFVHGLPGYARDGKPVYAREYRSRIHVAPGPIPVIAGLPLHAGLDQGLTPAILFFQEDTYGQLRVLQEVAPGHGTGIQRFVALVLPWLHGRFKGLPLGTFSGDPAGFIGADKLNGELAWMEAVSVALGLQIMPAPTQEPGIRQEAVKLALREIEPGKPGLIIDPEGCPILIEGFEAEYKFPKRPDGTHGDGPVKNLASNPHDALQYGILGVRGRQGVIQEAGRAGRPGRAHDFVPPPASSDWNVFT